MRLPCLNLNQMCCLNFVLLSVICFLAQLYLLTIIQPPLGRICMSHLICLHRFLKLFDFGRSGGQASEVSRISASILRILICFDFILRFVLSEVFLVFTTSKFLSTVHQYTVDGRVNYKSIQKFAVACNLKLPPSTICCLQAIMTVILLSLISCDFVNI